MEILFRRDFMRFKKYMFNKDPRMMYAKFNSHCGDCGTDIKKGDEFYFFPAHEKKKRALCSKCGEQGYRDFLASVQDEESYQSLY
jgi:hypothetical protein